MVKNTELRKLKKVGTYSATMSSSSFNFDDPAVEVGDVIFAQFSDSTSSVAVYKIRCQTAGTINVICTAAPGASSVLNYMIFTGGN